LYKITQEGFTGLFCLFCLHRRVAMEIFGCSG
jgi:hypothetical protein